MKNSPIIDVKAVPVGETRAKRPVSRPPADPRGRLDIAAFRVISERLLPTCEVLLGIPGLAEILKPHAEAFIAQTIPAVNIFEAPRPRRRLR